MAEKHFSNNIIRNSLAIFIIIASLFLAISGILAFFSSFTNSTSLIKSATVNVSHTLAINDSTDLSRGFHIEYNEIKKITILANNADENSIKVRAKVFIRLELPVGTPIENIKGLYLYPFSLSDDEIKADLALEIPEKAILPTILHNEPESPVVLQYELNSASIAIEANSEATFNAKMACSQTPDNMYRGIYANIYSLVVAVQYDYTTDNNIDEVIPAHEFGTFSSAIAATSITLDHTDITINGLMSGAILKLTILPESTYNRQTTWTSSDQAVATVDQNGIIISRNYGTTTITAKVGNRTATCIVTVEP